jgi:WD40 repeat protein
MAARSSVRVPEQRVVSGEVSVPPSRAVAPLPHAHETYDEPSAATSTDYPDASHTNRRPPRSKWGVPQVYPDYDTRSLDICGDYVCTTGYFAKTWDLKSGRMVLEHSVGEREVKITASAFKPGSKEQDGQYIWLGNNYGEIQEIDIRSRQVVQAKSSAHNSRCIVEMHRYRNSILSIDDDGKLHVWSAGNDGAPSLSMAPSSFRVARGHTFSIILQRNLWLASGKEIRVYDPSSPDHFHVTTQAFVQEGVSEVTTGAVISDQLDNVYFGHSDGKVTIYSASKLSCIAVVNVSAYRISTMSGAGQYLWAGFSTGMIYVYDTTTSPWTVKKDWLAHQHPVAKIVADRSSVWKVGRMQVASLGLDNTIRLWDGFLEEDWIEKDMEDHDVEYCDFREIKSVIVTWNAGASTPNSLRYDQKDTNFFREAIQAHDPPDLLVFGFQELVDLEDKKLTAKSLFKSSKKKDATDVDHMSRQYRAWRDHLVQLLEEAMPQSTTYTLLHTANMVGLFSCVFVRSTLRSNIRSLAVGEIKRGLGGLHGNKGALILRFILDDSSVCLTNCHLAAGQTQTVNRNNDVTAILESAVLPREADLNARAAVFVGGGDGSMIMDHEICILNGDLNYRIDTMGRDTVIKAVKANNLPKLLERDQLLVSRRRNPGFRLRAFNEQPIVFAPTYKYDVGTDKYDTSEKGRSPAWCDRVLYRGAGRIKPIGYQRHEVRVSDHRPVSATFKMRVKKIDETRRKRVWEESAERLKGYRIRLTKDAK